DRPLATAPWLRPSCVGHGSSGDPASKTLGFVAVCATVVASSVWCRRGCHLSAKRRPVGRGSRLLRRVGTRRRGEGPTRVAIPFIGVAHGGHGPHDDVGTVRSSFASRTCLKPFPLLCDFATIHNHVCGNPRNSSIAAISSGPDNGMPAGASLTRRV